MGNNLMQYKGPASADSTRLTAIDVSHENPLPTESPVVANAIRRIFNDYGDVVSVNEKAKALLKFGESQQVTTSTTTLMDLPTGTLNETFVGTNAITHISSSSGSDTVDVVIEGHTIDGNGDFTFSTQTVTLVGQTKTPLTTSLARCTRIYNNSGTDLVGNIYVYEDDTVASGVPATGSKVHCMITAGKNNSSKAATTISSVDYWIITSCSALFLKKGAGYGEVQLEIRNKGKTFRETAHMAVGSSAPHAVLNFDPPIIVPSNADVKLTAVADSSNTYMGGNINGYLAIVT